MRKPFLLLTFLLFPFLFFAQSNTITGVISDAESGEVLYGVNVVAKEDPSVGVTSDFDGKYVINVNPEWENLIFSYIGYDKVEVAIDGQSEINVTLGGSSYSLDQVVISASKKKEKILNAPASISIITTEKIQNQTSLTPIDNLKKTPGVDIMSTGLVGANVNLRGFNGVFNGQMLTMVDNRIGRVPSLRVNAFQLIPGNSYDIEKIEVVRGPASALYGPNAAEGVMHMITKSPIDIEGKQETSISMTTGLRRVIIDAPEGATFEKGDWRYALKPEFRTALKFSDKFGIKLSGKYLQGQDWEYYDPREPEIGQPIIFGRVQDGRIWEKDENDTYHDFKDANGNGYSIFDRNFKINNWNGDLRMDFRPGEDSEIVIATGISSTENLELTGLGAAQSVGWTYAYGQARARFGNLFAQYFVNSSNAGNNTYLIPQGSNPGDTVQMQLLVDQSKLHVVQLQHSAEPINKLKLIYGLDFLATRPESLGTVNGRFEDNDNFNQYGGYLQGEYKFNEQLKVVAAARGDYHSKIEEFQVSPRVAVVYKPDPKHTLRATYNKAFATPSNFSLSLDLSNGIHPLWNGVGPPNNPFNQANSFVSIRGIGNPTGYNYNFSPETGELQYLNLWDGQQHPVNETSNNHVYFQNMLNVIVAQLSAAAGLDGSALLPLLFGDPLNTGEPIYGVDGLIQDVDLVGIDFVSYLNNGDPIESLWNGTGDFSTVKDFESQKSETVETYELGYKGIIKNKLYLQVDAYYTQKKNLRSGLLNRSPYVVFDPNQLNEIFEKRLRDNLDFADNAALALFGGTLTSLLEANEDFVVTANGDGYDELLKIMQDANAQLGVGIVTPENEDGLVNQDMIVTYVNLGDVDIFGADIGLTYVVNSDIQVQGSYSFASKDELISNQGDIVAFNAPRNKFSIGLDHNVGNTGFGYGLNYRWFQGFPAMSTPYFGDIDSYGTGDIKLFYRPKSIENMQITLDVNNVLGTAYRSFPGAPLIGRMTFLKLGYTFK